jgi:6-phosphogluconolactonase
VIEHQGSSIDPERQTAPHPHSVTLGPENRFAYVPDLGTDQIVVYEMDLEGGTLTRHGVVDVSPGSGPRHLAFHPTNDQVYLINELNSTVVVFDRQEDGLLAERSTVSTLPTDFHGKNKTAKIAAHPTGRYIYGSNRGHDTIAAFAVEGRELALIDHTPTDGEWPRHFVIDPYGRFLFTENRHSDDIVAFSINVDTGKLTPTGERISIPQPVCMQWVPRP